MHILTAKYIKCDVRTSREFRSDLVMKNKQEEFLSGKLFSLHTAYVEDSYLSVPGKHYVESKNNNGI